MICRCFLSTVEDDICLVLYELTLAMTASQLPPQLEGTVLGDRLNRNGESITLL